MKCEHPRVLRIVSTPPDAVQLLLWCRDCGALKRERWTSPGRRRRRARRPPRSSLQLSLLD